MLLKCDVREKEEELKNIIFAPTLNKQLNEFTALRLRAVGG